MKFVGAWLAGKIAPHPLPGCYKGVLRTSSGQLCQRQHVLLPQRSTIHEWFNENSEP